MTTPQPPADLTGLGSCIRFQRQQLGLSQRELAGRLGWAQARVSELERGRTALPTLPRLAALATALEIPLSTLLTAAGFSTDPDR